MTTDPASGDDGSPADVEIRRAVSEALGRMGELVVLRRLTRAAGRRDWFLVRSEADLDSVILNARPHDAFSFFLRPQLPIRGTLDDELERTILSELERVSTNVDELVVGVLRKDAPLLDSEGFSPQELVDLESWLGERRGRQVVAGHHPPLLSRDRAEVVTAIVPDEQGNIARGVY